MHYGRTGVHRCTMGNQVYTSALWAIRCTLVHYGQSGVHHCTIGNQVYNNAPWAIRCTPVHYGQSGGDQCTMGKQVVCSQITLNFSILFSHFRHISQARKVKMTHFKSQKTSTGCGQCREGSNSIWGFRNASGRIIILAKFCVGGKFSR